MGKTFKIIVCGKKATGKTTILEQLIYNNASITNNSLHHQQQPHQLSTTAAVSATPTMHRPSTTSLLSNASMLSNSNSSSTGLQNDKYFSTIEDIYVACWEKDKGIKEKLRFYDTKGMEHSKDTDTLGLKSFLEFIEFNKINYILNHPKGLMKHLFPLVDGAVLLFSSNDPDSIQCVEKLKTEIEKSKDKKETCHFILIDNMMPIPLNSLFNIAANESLNISNKDLVRQDLQTRLKSNVYELSTLDKRDLLCKPFIDLATNITQINTKGSMNIVQSIKKPKVFSSNK